MEARIGARRPDVGEQVETLAYLHRRIDLAVRRVLVLVRIGRPEQDAVRAPRLLDDVGMDGVAVRAHAGEANGHLFEFETEPDAHTRSLQDGQWRGGDFRPAPT